MWAEAAAGWFEIHPSIEYRDTYTKMTQAVELYYGIADVYESLKGSIKKGWQIALTVEEVFIRVCSIHFKAVYLNSPLTFR